MDLTNYLLISNNPCNPTFFFFFFLISVVIDKNTHNDVYGGNKSYNYQQTSYFIKTVTSVIAVLSLSYGSKVIAINIVKIFNKKVHAQKYAKLMNVYDYNMNFFKLYDNTNYVLYNIEKRKTSSKKSYFKKQPYFFFFFTKPNTQNCVVVPLNGFYCHAFVSNAFFQQSSFNL